MSMPAENISDRIATDRSQQILVLLQELSERIRRSENERDSLRRELGSIRDMMQDLDDRNSQTQKAYIALENKFDGADNTVETIIRRLTGMEESVDKQSTQMLAILRKIEERFEAYDREYKNHAANITQFAETLDKYDKRLEKLMQDKGRLARKIDALEFQLVDTEEKLKTSIQTGVPVIEGAGYADVARSSLQVWTPEAARPQFMGGPAEIPVPRPRFGISPEKIGKIGQGAALAVVVLALVALGYGALRTLITHPTADGGTVPVVASDASGAQGPAVAQRDATTVQSVVVPAVAVKDKDFFSKTVRLQMDQQIVAARKLEDDDSARLMTMQDNAPLSKRVRRDPALSRVIKAIEEKAVEGSSEAQHDMGALYTSGQSGVPVDYARAAFWFREAAYDGVANARYNLGVLYQQGLGVEKDMDQALAWYRAAALLDHPEARYNLGIAYVEGIGAPYNPAMAAGYFEQAAKSGVIEAAYNLGLILENGLIDEPRPYEGLFWYTLAADRGSKDAIGSKARLMKEQKISDADWAGIYAQMLEERPDLKPLANSKASEGAGLQTNMPRVRVHSPADAKDNPTPNTARKINDAAGAKPSVPPPPPVTTGEGAAVKQGAIDAKNVSRIQMMLADEGLFTTTPTGQYGPLTAEAIRRYQIKYGMKVDGKASDELMAHMLARRLAASAQPAAGSVGKSASELKAVTSHDVND